MVFLFRFIKLITFSNFLIERKKNVIVFCIHAPNREGTGVGIIGPGSVLLTNRPSPRVSTGPDPKTSRPKTRNRPRNFWVTLHPGARAPLTSDASFPDVSRYLDTYHPGRLLSRCALMPGCFLSRSATLPSETANRLSMI